MIEPVQFLTDCHVQRMDIKKFPVPQAGNDMGGQISNTSLYGCLIPWSQHPGREQRCVIVIRQFLIRAVDDRIFVFPVAEDPNL